MTDGRGDDWNDERELVEDIAQAIGGVVRLMVEAEHNGSNFLFQPFTSGALAWRQSEPVVTVAEDGHEVTSYYVTSGSMGTESDPTLAGFVSLIMATFFDADAVLAEANDYAPTASERAQAVMFELEAEIGRMTGQGVQRAAVEHPGFLRVQCPDLSIRHLAIGPDEDHDGQLRFNLTDNDGEDYDYYGEVPFEGRPIQAVARDLLAYSQAAQNQL